MFDVAGDARLGKLIVRMDFSEKASDPALGRRTVVSNVVRSAGMVDPASLADPQFYELLKGSL